MWISGELRGVAGGVDLTVEFRAHGRECLFRALRLILDIILGGMLVFSVAPSFPFFILAGDSLQSPAPQSAPGNTLKIDAKLVPVRVVVRDSDGRAVGGLTKDDFQLSDNGKAQSISQFLVERSGGDFGGATTSETAPSNPPRAASGIFALYLIDDLHLEADELIKAREALAREFMHLGPTERAAIFTTSRQVQIDFTGDSEKLRATLERLKPVGSGAVKCPMMTYYLADLIQNQGDENAASLATEDALNCGFGGNPKAMNAARARMKSAVDEELATGRAQTQAALRILKDLVQGMSKAPGSRTIVLISPGILSEHGESENEIMDLAVRGDVTVSALDPGGLSTSDTPVSAEGLSVAARLDSSTIGKQAQLAQWKVLEEVADASGGVFFRNGNDLDGGLRRVASPPEYSYILAFSPDEASLDGKFHKLKVSLQRGGKLTLQARHGYFASKVK
jgi:VWFA-related protein